MCTYVCITFDRIVFVESNAFCIISATVYVTHVWLPPTKEKKPMIDWLIDWYCTMRFYYCDVDYFRLAEHAVCYWSAWSAWLSGNWGSLVWSLAELYNAHNYVHACMDDSYYCNIWFIRHLIPLLMKEGRVSLAGFCAALVSSSMEHPGHVVLAQNLKQEGEPIVCLFLHIHSIS